MSCNCSNNPCSCANANCACPPDYSINPATISCPGGSVCEDTILTSCVFTTQYLTCSQVAAGSSLDTTLAAMDAKICQCGSCSGQTAQQSPNLLNMSNFYVDSLNTVPGNGSVINPFQTIELAYAKVIGTGTVNSPQFTNVTIHVLSGVGYNTAQNIYIPSISWNFEDGVNVTFTGSGTYFIDSSVATDGAADFSVLGYINFTTSTGGFVKNYGSYVSGATNKKIVIYAKNIVSTVTNNSVQTVPLIYQYLTTTSNTNTPPETNIILQGGGSTGTISTTTQTVIASLGARLNINLNGGQLVYGINSTGKSTGNILAYTGQANNINTSFILINGTVWSCNNTDMFSVTGYINEFIIRDIKTKGGLGTPSTFLNIGNVSLAVNSSNDFTFLLDRVYLIPNSFNSGSDPFVIVFSGVAQTLDCFQMQHCVLYSPLRVASIGIDIRLGYLASGGGSVSCINTINGALSMTSLPSSGSGLDDGSVLRNASTAQLTTL